MHPVNFIRHSLRSLVACLANVLHVIKLPLTPLSYFAFCHLWPGVLDVSICSLLDRRDECYGEYLYHLLVPHSLEGLCQANTRGVGIQSHDAMILDVTILAQIFILPPPCRPRDPRHLLQPTRTLEMYSLEPLSKSPVQPTICRLRTRPQSIPTPWMT